MSETIKTIVRAHLSRQPVLLSTVHRLLGRPCEIAILRRIIHPGDIILDVGANIGQFALPLAHMVGGTGQVHAFEPTPSTFETLGRNLHRQVSRGTVILNQLALSESEGTATMYVPDAKGLEASLTHHKFSSWGDGQERQVQVHSVPLSTIDSYLKLRQLDHVDFLKCDVEGAELLVLKGAKQLLTSKCPPVLLLEIWSPWTKDFGYTPQELFSFLEEQAGYRFFHINSSGLRSIDTKSTEEPGHFPRFINFLGTVPQLHNAQENALRVAKLIQA